tara:strand:+ start:82 stop:306 length:225 start_codon:yes stop_codon:yes gene_type:complete
MNEKKYTTIFGNDLDPDNEMKCKTLPDGNVEATYKGTKMSHDSVIDEMEERLCHNGSKSIGAFAGFGKGTLNKR